MKTLSGEMVKKMHLQRGVREFSVEEDTFVTQSAKAYMEAEGLTLIKEGPKSTAGAKPEHMTHLSGSQLVEKSHARIRFRGMLDSFQADILCLQTEANVLTDRELMADLEEVLCYCRSILACEVLDKPLSDIRLFGFDEKKLREVSQNPGKYFGVGHVPPSCEMGRACVFLNRLRTQSREAELAGIAAFCPDGKVLRNDILTAMNRLSSGLYILFLKQLSREKEG